ETSAALARWQQARGLAADGIAGPETLSRLGRLVPLPPRATTPSPTPAQTYVVRSGDSLTAIADRFGTTIPALARANRLEPAPPAPGAADRPDAGAPRGRRARSLADGGARAGRHVGRPLRRRPDAGTRPRLDGVGLPDEPHLGRRRVGRDADPPDGVGLRRE